MAGPPPIWEAASKQYVDEKVADCLPSTGKAADSAQLVGLPGDRFYALRGSLPNDADLNNYTAIGVWQSAGSSTTNTLVNRPSVSGGVLTLEVHQGQHNQTMMVTQRVTHFNGTAGANPRTFVRQRYATGTWSAWAEDLTSGMNVAQQYRSANAGGASYYLKIASFDLAISPPTSGTVRQVRLKVRMFRSSLAYNGEYVVSVTLSGVPPDTTAVGFVTYTARDIYGTDAQFSAIKDVANNRFDIWCWGRTNFSSLTVELDMQTAVRDSMTYLPDGTAWTSPDLTPADIKENFVALPQEQTATREWTKTFVPVASTTLQKSNTTSNWIKIAQANYPGMSTSTGNRQVRLQVDTRNGGAIGWSRYILRLRFSTQNTANLGVVYGTPAADVTEQQIGSTREPVEFAYVLDDTARVVFIYAFTAANYAQLTVSLADTNSNDNTAITILPDGAGWLSPRPFPAYNPPPGGTDTVLTNNVYIPFNPGAVVLTNQNGIQQMNVGLPAGTDLNDIRTPGVYGCNSSTVAGNLANIPKNMGSRYFTLFVHGTVSTGTSGIVTQMLVAYGGVEGEDSTTYTRVLRNAGGIDYWSNWTQSNSGVVGQYTTFGIANIFGQRLLGTPVFGSAAAQQDVIIQHTTASVGVYSFDLCMANNSYGQVVKRFSIRTTAAGVIDTSYAKSQILEFDSNLNNFITIGEPYQADGDLNIRVPIVWISGNVTYRVSVKMIVASNPESYYSLGPQAVAPTGVLRLAQQPNCVQTNTLAYGIPPRSLPSATDLNTITQVGVYMATSSAVGATIVNAPPGIGQPFRLEVKQTNDSVGNVNQVVTMLYTSTGYANGIQFIRSCNAGSWTRWKQLDTSPYSVNEIWTGSYWTDGKPVYRRVFADTCAAVLSTNKTIATIAGLDVPIKMDGFVKYVNGHAPINSIGLSVWVYTGGAITESHDDANYNNAPITVVAEYTKVS